jgi:hypothetical protein
MGGGILQLMTTGIQDLYLTNKPKLNFFQYVYYRHVNFSTETLNLPLNQSAQFGTKCSIDIPKKGHLLSKLYLRIKLPTLRKIDGSYACWSDTLGYAIFSQPVELLIGGIVIDKLYPVCMDMLNELTASSRKEGIDQMLLKSDIFTSNIHNADYPVELMIPLDFWFTKKYVLALPLLSMVNQDISMNFYFKDFQQLINYDGTTSPLNVEILDSSIYAEYIYLDDIILETFQKEKHQFIIEQQFYHGDEYINQNQTTFTTKINFQNPCKELLFACIDENNIDNNSYFNYSLRNSINFNPSPLPLISQATLMIDGKHRFNNDYLSEHIFRQYFPNNIHSVIPNKHMYVMPFCLNPEENQPSGSINLSRFDEVDLMLKLPSQNPSCQIHIYGIMINVITIENGGVKFEFLTQ